jgi:hypothetical protein
MIYLDNSVALAYLLAEDRFPSELLWDQLLVSSRLLECEVWNRVNAHQLQNSHGDAVRNLIGRVAMIEMVGPVLERALRPFPVPVDAGCHSPISPGVRACAKSERAAHQLRRTVAFCCAPSRNNSLEWPRGTRPTLGLCVGPLGIAITSAIARPPLAKLPAKPPAKPAGSSSLRRQPVCQRKQQRISCFASPS